MAKSWCVLSNVRTNGNVSVRFDATKHTGRTKRTYQVTVKDANQQSAGTITVNQAGASIFVTIDAIETIPKTGGIIFVTGKSNSDVLTFTSSDATNFLLSDFQISKNSDNSFTSIQSGSAIPDDPGQNQQYAWKLKITATANTTATERTATLTVKASETVNATKQIKQNASESSLSIEPDEITLNAEGTVQTVMVTANIDWSPI